MKLLLDRFKSNDNTTLGKLYIDDIFECYILEDEFRTVKVWGETRIPKGTYEIKFRKEGKFHERYLKRFPAWHLGMLHLQDIPNFKYVYIHIGNDDDDTAGCLLTGKYVVDWRVAGSTVAYEHLYKQVAAALLQHEEVIIEIQDNDGVKEA